MISASRAGLSDREASRTRRWSVHSGMVDSRDEAHRVDKGFPGLALADEDAAALGGQAVEAASSLAGLLHPPSLEPPAFFQPVEERIERRDMELQLPGRARLDQFADLISVTRARFNDREDDQLRRPLLQFAVE